MKIRSVGASILEHANTSPSGRSTDSQDLAESFAVFLAGLDSEHNEISPEDQRMDELIHESSSWGAVWI